MNTPSGPPAIVIDDFDVASPRMSKTSLDSAAESSTRAARRDQHPEPLEPALEMNDEPQRRAVTPLQIVS